jgi:hypothetical protein
MPAVAGSALLAYHGASARRSCRPAGSWPAVAYQVTAAAWQAIWNGTVRSTARAVRLRACADLLGRLRSQIPREDLPHALEWTAAGVPDAAGDGYGSLLSGLIAGGWAEAGALDMRATEAAGRPRQ